MKYIHTCMVRIEETNYNILRNNIEMCDIDFGMSFDVDTNLIK